MQRVFKVVLPALVVVAAATLSWAQGVQTGVLAGFVRGVDDLSLPGATVTVSSPALQGQRTTVTDVNGAYIIRGLPPGTYSVTFEFPDMRPVTEDAVVPLGGTANLDARLTTVTATEAVTVIASTPSILTRPTAGLNIEQRDIDMLPTGRTPALVAELAPGLTNNTPNNGQVTISGSFAFDNVFMIDGVDVNDNLFGTSENLFIEDAVQETQVLTSGISAEYGRFSGGVINVITKRGGNNLSGSFRVNLSNPAWTDETPFEKAANQTRQSVMNQFQEGTLGGPIIRDRVWFFFAARNQETTTNSPLPQTQLPFEQVQTSRRWELKGTATPIPNQTFQAAYTDNAADAHRMPFAASIDPFGYEDASFPSHLFVANWNGVLANRFYATAQVSSKISQLQFSRPIDQLRDSPFRTIGLQSPSGLFYNGPYFDYDDPENRDNNQIAGSISYFASSPRFGTHDLKGGIERFVSTSKGGNGQAPLGFIFFADYLASGGQPATTSDGRLIPLWVPGTSFTQEWIASPGAELDINTTSFYFQDRWTPLRRLTLDLGVRYERVRSEATGDIIGADTDTVVPRLGATFDMSGDGKTLVSASYAHYAGKYSVNYFGRNSTVTNPARITRVYVGPSGQGLDFAPAYDPANYLVASGNFPSANVFLEDGLSSPITREFTVSAGREIGERGVVRAVYTWRNTSNFIENFVDNPTASGKTSIVDDGVTYGPFDNQYYRNSDEPGREYSGLQFQGQYRLFSRFTAAGNYTIQLRNHGNYEGEAANQPGIGSTFGDYPEILVERNNEFGRLDDYQRHKIRLWAIYNVDFGSFGSLDVAPIWRYNSALTYTLFAAGVPLSSIQRSRNPGYASLPGSGVNGSQTLFFDERGSEEFAGYGLVDLGLTYQVPVWRTLRPWIKFEMLNAFNNDKLIAWDTTLTVDPASPLDADGLPTGYIRGPRFGQGTATSHYPRPRPGTTGGRTFLGAFGLRF